MENASFGSRLRARWYLVLIAALIACAVGLSGEYTIGHSGLKSKDKPMGVGSAQLLVDSRPSTLATLSMESDEKALDARAPLYAEFATGTAVKTQIAQLAGIPFDSLTVLAATNQVTSRESSAAPPAPSTAHYVTLTAGSQSAVIRISSVAHTARVAERLAAATATALRQSVARLAASEHVKSTTKLPVSKVVLRELGAPTGSTVLKGASAKKSIAYGAVTFIVLLIVIILIDNVLAGRARRRRSKAQVATP